MVVSGMTSVEGWPASRRACDWTTRTGRVFTGSVPRLRFKSVSQTCPRFNIGIPVNRLELLVYTFAFLANFERCRRQTLTADLGARLAVHLFDCLADISAPGHLQGFSTRGAVFE